MYLYRTTYDCLQLYHEIPLPSPPPHSPFYASPLPLTDSCFRSLLLPLVVTYSWVQEYTWETTEPTVIDPDLFLAKAGPKGMAFSKITPRK